MSKITQLKMVILINENILWFYIKMDNSCFVRINKSSCYLLNKIPDLLFSERMLGLHVLLKIDFTFFELWI